MLNYRIDRRFHIMGAGMQAHGGMWPSAAGGWWTSGGATGAVAVYQPKGAASYAASLVNLANPGTYDATSATAPAWAAGTGWSFAAASSQYVSSGVTPANDGYSYIARFTNAAASAAALFGFLDGAKRVYILPYQGGAGVSYSNHNYAITVIPDHVNGTLAVTGNDGYRDGVSDTVAIGDWTTGTAQVIYIGAIKRAASVTNYFTGEIQAFAMYNNTLDATAVAAVSAAMSLL